LFRSEFLHGITAALAGSAVSLDAASPHPPTPGPALVSIASCEVNPVLPYNKPLELTMRVLDGPDFDLMKYRGYAVWINIFATWCPPCNQEQPMVERLAREYYDRGLRVIGMDCAEEDDTVRAYRKKYALTYPIAMDKNGGFTHALESHGDIYFPGHLFFTSQGVLNCYYLDGMGERMMRYKIEQIVGTVVDASPSPGPIPTRTPFPTPTPAAAPSPRAI